MISNTSSKPVAIRMESLLPARAASKNKMKAKKIALPSDKKARATSKSPMKSRSSPSSNGMGKPPMKAKNKDPVPKTSAKVVNKDPLPKTNVKVVNKDLLPKTNAEVVSRQQRRSFQGLGVVGGKDRVNGGG
jgi:hypothetical protein